MVLTEHVSKQVAGGAVALADDSPRLTSSRIESPMFRPPRRLTATAPYLLTTLRAPRRVSLVFRDRTVLCVKLPSA